MREGGSLSSNLANAGHLVRRRPEFDRVESKKKQEIRYKKEQQTKWTDLSMIWQILSKIFALFTVVGTSYSVALYQWGNAYEYVIEREMETTLRDLAGNTSHSIINSTIHQAEIFFDLQIQLMSKQQAPLDGLLPKRATGEKYPHPLDWYHAAAKEEDLFVDYEAQTAWIAE